MKLWPQHKSYVWERAPFIRLLLPLLFAILLYKYLSGISVYVLIAMQVLMFAAYIVCIRMWPSKFAPSFVAANLFIFCSGLAVCHINDDKQNGSWMGNANSVGGVDMAIVTKNPEPKERTYKLDVRLLFRKTNGNWMPVNGNGLVYVYKDATSLNINAGDTIIIPSEKWQLIKNAGNPFEFDYAGYLARSNIYYRQFIASDDLSVLGRSTDTPYLNLIHSWCMRQLSFYVKDKETLGIIQAMLIGDEINLDDDIRTAYSETGIIHIIAISGSHIAILFFGIGLFFRRIKSGKYRWIKYITAIPFIWFYVLVAGAPPSAVRSAAMFSILGIGLAFRKDGNGVNQLVATAFIILLIRPMWVYSIGFQLSFVAVLSIMLFYKPLYNIYKPNNYFLKLLWSAVVISFSAELLVAPLVAFYFHIFPASFIITNVVAGVYAFIILFAGILILLFSWVSPLALAISSFASFCTYFFNQFILFFQSLNPGALQNISISVVQLLLLYAMIICMAAFLIKRNSKLLFAAGFSLAGFLAFSVAEIINDSGNKRFIVYNVSGANHIELLSNGGYSVLRTDGRIDAWKKKFAIRNAHIAWRSWKPFAGNPASLLMINNKKLLILDGPISGADFPVHYVVLNFLPSASDIQNIGRCLHPEKIVFGNNIKPKYLDGLLRVCNAQHIATHTVSKDGAFILEGD